MTVGILPSSVYAIEKTDDVPEIMKETDTIRTAVSGNVIATFDKKII